MPWIVKLVNVPITLEAKVIINTLFVGAVIPDVVQTLSPT